MEARVHVGDVLLGKYTVERVLGQGGMGMVLAARHRELGELFAIKLLLPQALANAQATERFLREARAAVRLKGDHIVRVHDVGKLETGAPYMVMEHLVGSDLQQVVVERGPLAVDEAVGYVLQACEAVAEAHAHGIVHRDLKPANLFLTRRPNGEPWVKVLDFGISKQLSPDHVELTKTGTLLGSPFYMSPEQMVRARRVDTRSDIWSMGVVLHHLLTGMLPFPAEDLTEVIAHVLHEEPIPPSRQRPGLPAEVDTVVALCLQRRPEHRFQTVDELAAALRVLLSSAGAPAKVATVSLRAGDGQASALAETQAALAQTPPHAPQPPPDGVGQGADQEMGHTLSRSAERAAPSVRRTAPASGVLRSLGRVAPIAAAVAMLGIVGGWLALQRRSAPAGAASASATEETPAPVVTPAGYEAPAPAAADTATPAAVDTTTTPLRAAAVPSSSAAPVSAEPAGSASAPPRATAPARRPDSAAAPAPGAAAPATVVAGNAKAPASPTAPPQPSKHEGLY
ncbi:serine/threonine-protein kinase [Sorangium sp. So ce341]|uniref:serine/threonine-protein kinase n=1 Tax=Sorangium sp. So ce341 TaxID=3133302 RepID=UPI003F5E39B8